MNKRFRERGEVFWTVLEENNTVNIPDIPVAELFPFVRTYSLVLAQQ